jgi:hypothetical protein
MHVTCHANHLNFIMLRIILQGGLLYKRPDNSQLLQRVFSTGSFSTEIASENQRSPTT